MVLLSVGMNMTKIPTSDGEHFHLEDEFLAVCEDKVKTTQTPTKSEILNENEESTTNEESATADLPIISLNEQPYLANSDSGNSVDHNVTITVPATQSRTDSIAHVTPASLNSINELSSETCSSTIVHHCYCKTTNLDLLSMVVCEGCGLYFHQDCFHKGRFSSLLGDKFIEFFCETCGSNQEDNDPQTIHGQHSSNNVSPLSKERIIRRPHTWVTAVALALFNLHTTRSHESRKGYFQWREQVCRYIEERWTEFFSDRKKAPKWQGAVACTLSTNTGVLFRSGVSEIDEQGWWKLIENVPPDPKNPIPTRGSGRRKRGPSDEALPSVVELGPRIRKRPTFDGQTPPSANKSLTNRAAPNRRGPGLNSKIIIKEERLEPDSVDEIDIVEQSSQLELNCNKTTETRKGIVTASKDKGSSSQFLSEPIGLNSTEQDPVRLMPMSVKNEKTLLEALEEQVSSGTKLDQHELRFLNKLRVRQIKREKGLQLFDLDKEVLRLSKAADWNSDPIQEMLDQFVHTNVIGAASASIESSTGHSLSFAVKLLGSEASSFNRTGFRSPYTQRLLKPYIFRDLKPNYPRIKLMQEIHSHRLSAACRNVEGSSPIGYEVLSVDLVYIRSEHVAVINSICRSFFWGGIDMTGQLHYPEFSVVALYGKLVIGFACMAPLANCNDAYLSFLWTHPHFRRRGLARCMLYHLSQSCMGRDIVLHVAATNPAVFLYQSFKFRVEKVCLNFYDKYLPLTLTRKGQQNGLNFETTKESRHALFMRLKW